MSEHFVELAYNLAQEGLVPGQDFSYDTAQKAMLLGPRALAFIASVVPKARERFGWEG